MYPQQDFNCYQLIGPIFFSSVPYLQWAHAYYYFEVNPRHNDISSINISFCISKRLSLYFLNITTQGDFGKSQMPGSLIN